jgi:hypothetical protein
MRGSAWWPGFTALLLLIPAAAPRAGAAPPRLEIAVPGAVTSGMEIDASLRLATEDETVIGWSACGVLEGLTALAVTTEGTDIERFSRDGHVESGMTPDGSAFYSLGALSFTAPVVLPAGNWEILRLRLAVSRKDPGEAAIRLRDGIQVPGDERVFNNEVLLRGGARVSLSGPPALLAVTGCADFRFSAAGPGGPIEARHESPIEVTVHLVVASERHLQPTGFTLAAAHEPTLLGIESAEFSPAVEDWVAADGFHKVELAEDGFLATVVSSSSSPRTLGPGAHPVLDLRYRFHATAISGARLPTAIVMRDDLVIGGEAARNSFSPGGASPCELAALPLELVVGPGHWIRGDGNGSGTIDLTDGINILDRLFRGAQAPCERAMEANADGTFNLSDAIYLLSHLFLGRPPPPSPFPDCGAAEETLPCQVFACPAAGR